jgi:two-component system, OmpR family, response regulator
MKKVLVIDDSKSIRSLLAKCLEIEGYEVLTANDGLQALDLLKSEKFDLFFLDIKMPKVSGTEVLKKIREIGIKSPVIIITAYATIKNAVDCAQLGVVAYLQKPFTVDKVKSVLQKIQFQDNNMMESIKQIEAAINNGLFEEALKLLKEAISIEPTNAELYLLFSKTYKGIGDMEYGEKFYQMYKLLSA